MKRFIAILLVLIAALPCLSACSNATIVSERMYVSHVDSMGFAAQIDGLGSVYIKYPNASSTINLNDSVSISYRSDRLHQEKGVINFVDGQAFTYEWVIEKVETLELQNR